MELKKAFELVVEKTKFTDKEGKPLELTADQKKETLDSLYYFYADAGKVTIRDLIDGTVAHYSESDKNVTPEVFAQMIYQLLQSARSLLAEQIRQAQSVSALKASGTPEKVVAEPVADPAK
ncbi:MAG: hypothetical protein ABFC95_02435 [Smithella sp.]